MTSSLAASRSPGSRTRFGGPDPRSGGRRDPRPGRLSPLGAAFLLTAAAMFVALGACSGGAGGAPDAGATADASTLDATDGGGPAPDGATAPDAAPAPWVEIQAPAPQQEVVNPVEIRFSASAAVRYVTLEADGWPLHDEPLDAASGSHVYTFSGVGYERVLVLTGLDAQQQVVATDEVRFTPVNPPLVFPLADEPGLILSHFDDPASTASFGAARSGGRVHAGCDLYWTNDGGLAYQTGYYPYNDDTPIYAVADGVIVDYYPFYLGTYALVVDHGDFTVRYGEVDDGGLPGGLTVGSAVAAGQQIATMGDLSMSSGTWSMLHFELYSNDATGPLTDSSNYSYLNVPDANYQRRADLMDCRPFLLDMLP